MLCGTQTVVCQAEVFRVADKIEGGGGSIDPSLVDTFVHMIHFIELKQRLIR